MPCRPIQAGSALGEDDHACLAAPHSFRTLRHHRNESQSPAEVDWTGPDDSRLNDEKKHIASRTVPRCVDPPAASRRKDKSGAPLVGVWDVPGRAAMELRPER